MDPSAVAKLARHESDRWQRGAAGSPRVIEPGPGAYMPLDGRSSEAGEPGPQIQYLGSTAIDTVLIIRFRWPLDGAARDLLLPIDFRDYLHGVDGASVWILEYVQQCLHHDRDWFPRDVVPVSAGAAIVRPSRQPGQV